MTSESKREPLVSPFTAVFRHPFIAVLIVVVMTGIGIAVGTTRPIEYRAQATLGAGQSTTAAQSIPGYTNALQALAATYSRLATSAKVTGIAGRELGIPSLEVQARVTASNVPQSNLVIIEARGEDRRSTIRLANATANALSTYASSSQTTGGDILKQYEAARRSLSRARSEEAKLQRQNIRGDRKVKAQAKVAAAELRSDTLATAYTQAQTTNAGTQMTLLTPATSVVSDRRSTIQLFAVAGGLFGIILATLGLTWWENRPRRKADASENDEIPAT